MPNFTTDLATIPSPRSKQAADLAEQVVQMRLHAKRHLELANATYKAAVDVHRRKKVFKEGDLVMVHLRHDRFPTGSYHKLHDKKIGPVPILRRINGNAYVVHLPPTLHCSPTFNVSDFYDYVPPDDAIVLHEDSGSNPVEEEEPDAEHPTVDKHELWFDSLN